MKTLSKIFVIVLVALITCNYLGINIKEQAQSLMAKANINIFDKGESKDEKEIQNDDNQGSAYMIDENTQKISELKGLYDEIIKFILEQKKDRKLIENYWVYDDTKYKYIKGTSGIYENAIAAIALLNHGEKETEKEAIDILKNLSLLQNSDGSWYSLYDVSGNIYKREGNDLKSLSTGYNALLLYAYSYYTIFTGEGSFLETMKKSANYILSKADPQNGGIIDSIQSDKEIKTTKSNIYAYYALREYAFCNIKRDYLEYKEKSKAADKIAEWIKDSCIGKNTVIKGYTGADKLKYTDIDTFITAAFFVSSLENNINLNYGIEDFKNYISQISKKVGNIQGYGFDIDDKDSNLIWCEGVCKMPIAFFKLGDEKSSSEALSIIRTYQAKAEGNHKRGIPNSLNTEKNPSFVDLESVSASSWAAISYQILKQKDVNSIFLGKEGEIFKKVIGN